MSNKVMKDDTGQAINTTLQSLVEAISPKVGYDVIPITTDTYGQANIGSTNRRAIVSMRVLADRRFVTASGYITDSNTTVSVRITDQTGAVVGNTNFNLMIGYILV